MLEIARLFAANRAALRRALRICFWSGHSHGRYSGSAWYADAFWHDLDARCLAHVNADSTGARGASVLTNSGAAAELRAVAAEAIRAHSGQTHAGRRLARQGDESFWGVGIPAMFGSLSHQPVPADGSPHFHLGYWWHTPEDTLDKIDPENLARDTGIFAHVLWRLLADRLVPLDYAEHARDLVAELRAMPEGLDLAPLVAAAERLGETAGRLADADPDRANAALMAVSRALVPMDSTRGDRFVHDPALGQPGWPVLAPVRALRGAEPGSDAWRFRLVGARQAANRLRHALDLADRALAAAL
jgi:hypothetical protein